MDNVCIICREEMQAGNACKKLPCSHIFHKSCLRTWFQRQQTCPTCRTDILQRTAAPTAARGAAPAAAVPGARAGVGAGAGRAQQQQARGGGGAGDAAAAGAQAQSGTSGASSAAAAAPAPQAPLPPGFMQWPPQFAAAAAGFTQPPHLPPPLNSDNFAAGANNPFLGMLFYFVLYSLSRGDQTVARGTNLAL